MHSAGEKSAVRCTAPDKSQLWDIMYLLQMKLKMKGAPPSYALCTSDLPPVNVCIPLNPHIPLFKNAYTAYWEVAVRLPTATQDKQTAMPYLMLELISLETYLSLNQSTAFSILCSCALVRFHWVIEMHCIYTHGGGWHVGEGKPPHSQLVPTILRCLDHNYIQIVEPQKPTRNFCRDSRNLSNCVQMEYTSSNLL